MSNVHTIADKVTMSSKGQVVIPKDIRDAHGWSEGDELEVVDSDDGVTLRRTSPFKQTTVDEVSGCLAKHYKGKAVSIEQMDAAVAQAVKEQYRAGR